MLHVCMPKSSSFNHLGQHRIPLLGGFDTLLVLSLLHVCMRMWSSLNHLGHHRKPILSWFDTLMVSISHTHMQKYCSLNHLGYHKKHLLVLVLVWFHTLVVSIYLFTCLPKASWPKHLDVCESPTHKNLQDPIASF